MRWLQLTTPPPLQCSQPGQAVRLCSAGRGRAATHWRWLHLVTLQPSAILLDGGLVRPRQRPPLHTSRPVSQWSTAVLQFRLFHQSSYRPSQPCIRVWQRGGSGRNSLGSVGWWPDCTSARPAPPRPAPPAVFLWGDVRGWQLGTGQTGDWWRLCCNTGPPPATGELSRQPHNNQYF